MPKVFEINGYRFFFFSNEGDPIEPCHIHVRKGGGLAKFWVRPEVLMEDSIGFTAKELKFIESEIRKNRNLIEEAWNEFFADSVKATRVWFDESSMWLALDDGRMLAIPRIWFPRLDAATDEQLEKYELSGNGIGIHWDELDEDISVPNLLLGYRACRPRMVLKK